MENLPYYSIGRPSVDGVAICAKVGSAKYLLGVILEAFRLRSLICFKGFGAHVEARASVNHDPSIQATVYKFFRTAVP